MKIMIDIPKGFYEHVKGHKDIFTYGLINGEKIGEIIANGTVLSEPQDGDRAISLNAVIERIKNQYKEHHKLIPKWLSIGDLPSVSQMLKCPSCGLDVHSDFNECPRCGEQLPSVSQTGHWITSDYIRYECSECGWWYRNSTKYNFNIYYWQKMLIKN